MFARREKYKSPMREFLNEFASYKEISKKELDDLTSRFKEAIQLVNKSTGTKRSVHPGR